MRMLTLSLLLATGTISAWQQRAAPQQAKAMVATQRAWREVRPVVAWRGSYSAIREREYHVVRDAEAWSALWARHEGDQVEKDSYGSDAVPVVDFERYMIVAVFNGARWNTRAIELVSRADHEEGVDLRFDEATYQVASALSPDDEPLTAPPGATPEQIARLALERMDKADREREAARESDPNYTRAYGIFVLPRVDGAVALYENTQGLKNQPPIWRERHRAGQ